MNAVYLSVVVPVYQCAACLDELYARLAQTLSTISESYEIILVNDASPDAAWPVIARLAAQDKRVKGIDLSRNFGQHYAIAAGLDYAQGDWVVVMDCDLQDQPEEILKLYAKAKQGYDIVFGRRTYRVDSPLKKLGSKLFYRVYNYCTDSQTDGAIANFSIISSRVKDQIVKFKEQNRMFPLFVNWLGFERINIDIEHGKRPHGNSAYTFWRLTRLAVDNITSQSNKPLKLSIRFGFILALASLLYAAWLVFRYVVFSVPVAGWTSVMVSIYFLAGLLFANLGIVGLYLGKVFDETKGRPLYVIKKTTFAAYSARSARGRDIE